MNYGKSNTRWKFSFFILLLSFFVLGMYQIKQKVVGDYQYEKNYGQYWELSDKSSTITAKQEYIVEFQNALMNGKTNGAFAEFNAVFLQTQNNNFDANLKALETLSQRLTEIQEMDPSSFEYNTAIQQITQQEQGEASKMLDVFHGCFMLQNYMIAWGWVAGITVVSLIIIGSATLFCLIIGWSLD